MGGSLWLQGTARRHCAIARATPDALDAYALRSHERAQAATRQGRFASEIVPVAVRRADGREGRPDRLEVVNLQRHDVAPGDPFGYLQLGVARRRDRDEPLAG